MNTIKLKQKLNRQKVLINQLFVKTREIKEPEALRISFDICYIIGQIESNIEQMEEEIKKS